MKEPEAERRKPDPEAGDSFGLTLRALAMFVLLNVCFRFMSFERVHRLFLRDRRVGASPTPADGPRLARRTFQAVQQATMLYYRRRKDCLPKAVTTFVLLARQGIPAELCFGVKKFPFSAHAWVDAYGEHLTDEPAGIKHYNVIHRVSC